MKVLKKLLIALVMLLAFSLIACESATEPVTSTFIQNEDYVNQEDFDSAINELELQNALLREIIDSMIKADEANGQLISYEAFMNNEFAESQIDSQANFDTTLAPSYMLDENGEYITFEDLAILLKDKYFGDSDGEYSSASDNYRMIPYASMTFTFEDNDLGIDEATARVILLIEELVNYSYYSLSGNGIDITVIYSYNGYPYTINCIIPKVVITNDIFTITYDSLIANDYESYIYISGAYFDKNSIKVYYDDFVLNGTYDGYVLNYVE